MSAHLDVLFRGDVAPLPQEFREGEFIYHAEGHPDEVLLQLSENERRLVLYTGDIRVCTIVRHRKPGTALWRSMAYMCTEAVTPAEWSRLIKTIHEAFVIIADHGGCWERREDKIEGVLDAAEALA